VVDGGTNQTPGRRPARQPRRDRSRGAVLIEAAILLPLLVLLTFGAVEYGLIFRDELKITTAARSGARIGTADKTSDGSAVNPDDDYQILQAVYAALGNLAPHVIYVSVYNAGTNSNGVPPAGCTGPGAASVTGSCNVWSLSDFSLTAAQVEASTKNLWPSTARPITLDTNTGTEPTYLGVEVEITHNYVTGLFGSSRTLLERAIFRFEPVGDTSHCNCVPIAPNAGVATTSTSTTSTTISTTSTTHHGGGGTTSTTGGGGSTTSNPTTSSTQFQGPTTTFHGGGGGGTTSTTGGGGGGGGSTTTTSPPATTTTTQIVIIPT
jgi:Flp pilus assembly protein TadG